MRKPVITLLAIVACICTMLVACTKEYSLETNQGLAAEGSLLDSTGNCMPDTVMGTFYGGIEPGRDTAYVLVHVNVTVPGTYAIYTDTKNGFYFSDSGYFSTTGLTSIKLKPIGVPIIPGATDFSVTFDSSVCYFTVNVQDSTGTGLGGTPTDPNQSDSAWQFTGPVASYNGSIDTAYTKDTVFPGPVAERLLYITGFTHATSDSVWQVLVGFTSGDITPGSYSTKGASAAFGFGSRLTGDYIYDATFQDQDINTIVNITSYDATTKIVTGTFSGTAKDASRSIVSITNGAFTAKVH